MLWEPLGPSWKNMGKVRIVLLIFYCLGYVPRLHTPLGEAPEKLDRIESTSTPLRRQSRVRAFEIKFRLAHAFGGESEPIPASILRSRGSSISRYFDCRRRSCCECRGRHRCRSARRTLPSSNGIHPHHRDPRLDRPRVWPRRGAQRETGKFKISFQFLLCLCAAITGHPVTYNAKQRA